MYTSSSIFIKLDGLVGKHTLPHKLVPKYVLKWSLDKCVCVCVGVVKLDQFAKFNLLDSDVEAPHWIFICSCNQYVFRVCCVVVAVNKLNQCLRMVAVRYQNICDVQCFTSEQ